MKKKLLLLLCLSITFSAEPRFNFDRLKKKVSTGFGRVKKGAEKVGRRAIEVGKTGVEKATGAVGRISEVAKAAWDNFRNITLGKPAPKYCTQPPLQPYAPTVKDSKVREADIEGMIPTIEKYSPVLYLCYERYLPIAVEDYFNSPGTQLVHEPGRKDNAKVLGKVVVPAGQVTMEKIYEVAKTWPQRRDDDLYFAIDECVEYGSDPAKFTDAQGNLTTPCYVAWYKQHNKIYICYLFTYGLNGPYTMKIPATRLPLLKGDILDFQNAHEFDLEHIVLELNSQTRELERIFYAAHGSEEGVWLPAKHEDVQYENGTHPVVFVAHGGHGSYPREGNHIRIFGFANDLCKKERRWVPQLVLLYPEGDPRFNPKTMGWTRHIGDYGRRGVASLANKDWFYNADPELRAGMPHERVVHCPLPTSAAGRLKYMWCVERSRMNAQIPGKEKWRK